MGNESFKTMAEVFLVHRAPHLADRTLLNLQLTIRLFAAYLERTGGVITTTAVLKWIDELKAQNLLGSTINGHIQRLRALFNYAIDYGHWQGVSPVPRRIPVVSVHKERPIITLEQHNKLRYWLVTNDEKEWWTATYFGWHFGMRLGDAVTQEWKDIDFVKRELTYTPIKTRRFEKSLTLPIGDMLIIHLKLRKEKATDMRYITPLLASEYRNGGDCSVSARFNQITREALGVNLGFHSYRHALVTRLISGGVNPPIISSITGHSLRMIMTYSHPSVDIKRQVLEAAS